MLKSKISILTIIGFVVLFSCKHKQSVNQIIDPIVKTQYGVLQGQVNTDGNVVAFKGIPYAEPPVGDLRWKDPQPPIAWDGTRDATKFCSSCIQVKAGSRNPWTEEFMVQDSISEDCLFLNIWTPAKTTEDKLPVLVYIHGGAFTEGSGSIDVYDGEELAKKGIIVITINYRLGILGFFVHPELSAESPHKSSGNYGLLDQVAALKWIKENISVFGGDPSRVTIAGQSAGAMSVRSLIASPLAAGLFQGAITESGSTMPRNNPMMTGSANTLSEAEKRGLEFARQKGVSSLAELRAMPALDLIAPVPDQPPVRFSTITDGYFQTDDMLKIFAAGKHNDTPFMTGMNAGETRYGGDREKEFMALYPSTTPEEKAAVEKTAGQEQSRLNTWLWLKYRAKYSKTNGYEYFFDRAIPWPEHPEFGAFHTAEVPYVFNNMKMMKSHTMEKADTIVADVISSYWANFVKTGDPNGPGLPLWAPFDSTKHEVMRLGENPGMIPIAGSEEKFEFLKRQLTGK